MRNERQAEILEAIVEQVEGEEPKLLTGPEEVVEGEVEERPEAPDTDIHGPSRTNDYPSYSYYDDNDHEIFVHDGISNGEKWGTFYRKPNGALKRVVSKNLLMRDTREEAQADLDAYAEKNGFSNLIDGIKNIKEVAS